jgi:hypothetical protein
LQDLPSSPVEDVASSSVDVNLIALCGYAGCGAEVLHQLWCIEHLGKCDPLHLPINVDAGADGAIAVDSTLEVVTEDEVALLR